jgi:hypothetical protein
MRVLRSSAEHELLAEAGAVRVDAAAKVRNAETRARACTEFTGIFVSEILPGENHSTATSRKYETWRYRKQDHELAPPSEIARMTRSGDGFVPIRAIAASSGSGIFPSGEGN